MFLAPSQKLQLLAFLAPSQTREWPAYPKKGASREFDLGDFPIQSTSSVVSLLVSLRYFARLDFELVSTVIFDPRLRCSSIAIVARRPIDSCFFAESISPFPFLQFDK